MAGAAAYQVASTSIQIYGALSSIYMQKINRDLQKRALKRQLLKAQEVSLQNSQAALNLLRDLRDEKMRGSLSIQKQKAQAKGQARVQAAQIGGSAEPAVAAIELAAGDASTELAVRHEAAVADIDSQARKAVQGVKDSLFSMDMTIDPYDIISPLLQIGSAATGHAVNMYSMGKNIYGQDIDRS
jgi:hypothetical protein